MTIEDCINKLIAKEKCMSHETSGIDTDCNFHNCDNCDLCYEQGTMGEQKEALKFAVKTMRKYQKIEQIVSDRYGKPTFKFMDAIVKVVEDGKDN